MLKSALLMMIALTLITGVVYPLAFTAFAYAVFPQQAGGSLVMRKGNVVGSRLIGQQFNDPKYFWSRPSATAPFPYNAASSSGSNYGPQSPDLKKAVESRRADLKKADPGNTSSIPIDLLTASASGLDPHISPEAAEYQAARVARVRGMHDSEVRSLIATYTQARQFGFLGQPVVNVLALNRALDDR